MIRPWTFALILATTCAWTIRVLPAPRSSARVLTSRSGWGSTSGWSAGRVYCRCTAFILEYLELKRADSLNFLVAARNKMQVVCFTSFTTGPVWLVALSRATLRRDNLATVTSCPWRSGGTQLFRVCCLVVLKVSQNTRPRMGFLNAGPGIMLSSSACGSTSSSSSSHGLPMMSCR